MFVRAFRRGWLLLTRTGGGREVKVHQLQVQRNSKKHAHRSVCPHVFVELFKITPDFFLSMKRERPVKQQAGVLVKCGRGPFGYFAARWTAAE